MSYTFFSKDPYFQPINQMQEIPIPEDQPYGWHAITTPEKFQSQNKIVRLGNQDYQITTKLERNLHWYEQLGEGILAVLMTVPTLFVGLAVRQIRDLWGEALSGKRVKRYGVLVPNPTVDKTATQGEQTLSSSKSSKQEEVQPSKIHDQKKPIHDPDKNLSKPTPIIGETNGIGKQTLSSTLSKQGELQPSETHDQREPILYPKKLSKPMPIIVEASGNHVIDPKYYPDFVDYKEVQVKVNDYFKETTFGPGFQPIEEVTLPSPQIPHNYQAEVKGTFGIVECDAGVIGSTPPPYFNERFERIDGINWREYPGDIFIAVELDCTEKKDNHAFLVSYHKGSICYLPAQLLINKKQGDIIQFLWEGNLVTLQIQEQSDVIFNYKLHAARKQAYEVRKGLPLDPYSLDPYSKDTFQYTLSKQVLQSQKRLALTKLKAKRDLFLYNQLTLSSEQPPSLWGPCSPDYRYDKMKNSEGKSLSNFKIELPNCEIKYYFYKEWIAIVGSKERERKLDSNPATIKSVYNYDFDYLFILDFRGTQVECSPALLKNLNNDKGVLSFQIVEDF